ncbi:MAG TPA: DNA polymerase [Pyrinomonadaceae bacterium]|jgi:DNA polymerase I-like protein with 3'-5' exonuclease and polymerase domains/intein/homing endonuclease
MEVYYQHVTNADDLRHICEEFSKLQAVGLDTETTDLDPYKGELRLIQLAAAADNIKLIDLRNFPDPKTNPDLDCLRDLLFSNRPTKVLHNAKFDAKWLRFHLGAELGGVFDTLLGSQIIAAGETDRRHNLADVTQEFLGIELDKSQQVSDWSAAELSSVQLEYGARDAAIVLPLREKMIERFKQDALLKVAQLEFECVMPVAMLELNGINIDPARWREQLAKVKKDQLVIADELQDLLAGGIMQGSLFGRPEINLDSHTQLTDALKRLGVPLPETTRNWQLEPLANDYPVVKKLIEYRTVAKAISSYGESFLEYINPKTGRIHADFRQIGAPTGRFSCITGDALVSTASGLKRMDKIQAGDSVKTPHGLKRVLDAWSNGVRPVFEIKLTDGRSIHATADHRFLTGRADVWKRLDELEPGEDLFVSLKTFSIEEMDVAAPLTIEVPMFRARKPINIPTELSIELCEMLGLATADGYLGVRQNRRAKRRFKETEAARYDRLYLAFNRQDDDLIERMKDYSQSLFGRSFVEVKSRTCRVLQLASTRLAEFFARLGFEGNAHTKRVPEIILNAPPVFQAAFLRGLFEGDGHRFDGASRIVGLTSVNANLLGQVQTMLANLGIYGTVKMKNDASGFAGGQRFVLTVTKKTDLQRFMQKIGFLSKRKNLSFVFENQFTDGVATPFVLEGKRLYREAVALGVTPASRAGVKPFVPYYKNSFVKAESIERLTGKFGILPSFKPILNYLELGLRQVKIKSIAPCGKAEVFDLTIEDVHQFIANGIVVHNCNNPNVQQVPHGEVYRRCFRAPEGRKLVISDYSQIELRILADFTGDEGFVSAFNSGQDLHKSTASQIFNVPIDAVTSDQRSFAKRINFGVVYGIGAQRVANLTGISIDEARSLLSRYFQTYPRLDAWLRDAAVRATRERQARTASGRLARFRFDPEDRQAVSLAERNGKNTPIQGCVHGETRIFEQTRGYVPIQTLVDEPVSVWDGERFVKAFVASSGEKRLVNLEFWGGYSIQCSPEHKFLTIDVNGRKKWRTPGEFVKGNYVVLTEPVGEWSVDLNLPEFQAGKAWNSSRASLSDAVSEPFDLGIWLGRLASDGSLQNHQAYLLVAEHEEVILPQIRKFTEKFGHISYQVKTGGRGTQPIHFLTVSALGLTRQLESSGLKNRIPDFAWRSSRILAGYLRGMFDGDGTVNADGAVLTFGKGPDFYLEWAREIQQALLLFGVRSRVNRCADRINVCVLKRDMPLFCRKIGFLNPLKQARAEAVLPLDGYENKIYGRAARVKRVEFTEEFVEMYDVVNSETERFMANGLVTHNSSADILKRALRLLHEELRGTSACLVNIIHDEIVVETDAADAEKIVECVERAMCQAGEEYVKKVPVKVESVIADEWLK